MRVVLAALVLVTGCRQLLGFDDPTLSNGTVVDGSGGGGGSGHDGAAPFNDARTDGLQGLDAQPSMIEFIQSNWTTNTNTTNVEVTTLAFSQPQSAGDLNLVAVSWVGGGTVDVTDTIGNTYTPITPLVTSAAGNLALAIANGIGAGANAVTATFSTTFTNPQIQIVEYAGLAETNVLDGAVIETGTGTKIGDIGAITSHAHDLVVGIDLGAGTTTAADPQFTARITTNSAVVEDREVELTGTYDPTVTQSPSAAWIMRVIALEGAP